MKYHALTIEQTLKSLKTEKGGLSVTQSKQRSDKVGPNKISQKKKKGLILRLLEQFKDFMVIVLLISSIISFVTSIIEQNNDYIDSIIILVIVFLNAIMGVVQEYKAERAIESLQKLSVPKARVLRSNKEITIDSENLVPGDVILLSRGELVPADARLIQSHDLKVEESSLTGESHSVSKDALSVCSENAQIAEKHNMVFATSNVTSGRCRAVVTAIGMETEVGKIAKMIDEDDVNKTPLQKKLSSIGKFLGIAALCICLAIFFMGVIKGVPILDMFMISISLAVAAIPEGLPAVVTIVLALGVRRMAMNRAIIRRLPAVETLGGATVICSDKTGTLTQNKMKVMNLASVYGKVDFDSKQGKQILTLATMCSNQDKNPTEVAIIKASAAHNILKEKLDLKNPRISEIPFDSGRKLMTTVHKLPSGGCRVITKGAPDVLINICTNYISSDSINDVPHTLSQSMRQNIQNQNEVMASEAMRVIAVAYKDVPEMGVGDKVEAKLTFCGLIGIVDPPRPEAKKAVNECIRAGIKPVMITGDNLATACAIARNVGIMGAKEQNALTGAEIQSMTQDQLQRVVENYSVFARVSPEHKVRIVKAFQANGEVVAMTGDGVNDAPALKAADIGCAMGTSGTDVAKSASDMILTDDNFATIVAAIREGRGIFENIRKTIRFLLSSNTGEIITVFVAFLFGMPAPLLAVQLLWVNLVTDSFPALALGVEPTDKNIMDKKFLSGKKSFFSNGVGYNIIIEGCFIGSISILAFVIGRCFFDVGDVPQIGRTMAFGVLSLSQIVHSFNVRSDRSLLHVGFFSNMKMIYSSILCIILQISVMSVPCLTTIFKTVFLTNTQWLIVLALSLSPLVIVEIEKQIFNRS